MEISRNKCRVCLRVGNAVPLLNWNIPIDDINESLSYAICFQECTQLNLVLNCKNVSEEPSMRIYEYFCYSCAAKLKEAYVFIKKAKETDSVLRTSCGELELSVDKKTFEWVEVEKEFSCVDNMEIEEEFLDENAPSEECVQNFKDGSYKPRTPKSIPSKISRSSSLKTTDVKNCGDIMTKSQYLRHSCSNVRNPWAEESSSMESINVSNKEKKCTSTKAKHSFGNKKSKVVLSCKICGLSFTKNQVFRHRCNRGPERFLCKSCPRTFSHRNTLIQHELIHERNRERKYDCSVCGRKFYTQMARRNHLKTHDPSRKPRFHCGDCGQSFLFKGNLLVHQQKHAGQTIQCNYCQKRYVRSVDLEVHLRSHTGDMPFKCDKCEKAFTKRSTLRKHSQLHDGVQWKCEDCGKEYLYEWTLQRHRLEHTGLPLKCSICEKEFPEMYKIKRHIKCVHKVNLLELENFVVRLKENKKPMSITKNLPETVNELL